MPLSMLGESQYAGRIAKVRNGRLYLMHVLGEKPPAEGQEREWIEANRAELLMQMLEPSDRDDISSEALIADGNPAQEILAASIARHVDLLVLGVAEHGQLSDHAPWRTLTEIIEYARCPILCVGSQAK